MTVIVSAVEPNIFPAIDLVDARANGIEIEMVLVTRTDGQPVRVRVRLNRAMTKSLIDKLNLAMMA